MNLRPFSHADLPLLQHWLDQEHIRRQFGDPEIWLDEIGESLDSAWVSHYIACVNHVPVGFGQVYDALDAPPGPWTQEALFSAGIDYLIGNTDYLGKGLGKRLVALLLEQAKSKGSFDYVLADPDPGNIKSASILEKLGFRLQSNGLYRLNISDAKIEILKANTSDIKDITTLFQNTIEAVNSKDYSPPEIDDWASWSCAKDRWAKIIEEQFVVKALIDNIIVGFGSVAKDGYIDFLFTHKDFQNKGIASAMICKIEALARRSGQIRTYTDASISARKFFEGKGYVLDYEWYKKSRNLALLSNRMHKMI
jgi:GNAT superfamily N-acetyltransferase